MIAFIGLGNPGDRYSRTKHNAGYWVIDELAKRWSLNFQPGKGDYVYAEGHRKSTPVLLAKPTPGMNVSGPAVRAIVHHWNLDLSNVFVVVDDVDLPLGTLRIRPSGGDGCHRGMESVIYQLRDDNFPRIRVGIATAEQTRPAEKFVLKPFRKEDEPLAEEMVAIAADAAEMILARGLNQTMNEFNRMKKIRETA